MIPACSSLMRSFNKGNTDGTNSLKMCFMFVYTSMFYVGIGFVD